MNGVKLGLSALFGAGLAMTAMAEPIMTKTEIASLEVIADESCSEPVIFVPLSEDVEIDQRIYAVVPAADTDVNSAHLVSASERNWLVDNGCRLRSNVIMASNEYGNPELN